jgi:hypothetical protein
MREWWKARRGWVLGLLVGGGVTVWLWRQVFVVTGLLWWNTPLSEGEKHPPPPTPRLELPDTQSLDLEAYRRQHEQEMTPF